MSLANVRPYFKARALEQGWKEWKDAFNIGNIPATLIDGSFHVEMGDLSQLKFNQYDLETEFPVTVRYFKKGFKDPQGALDLSIASTENYIRASLKATNRLTGVGIKNVRLVTARWVRYDTSNDNLIMAEMQFTALVILAVD